MIVPFPPGGGTDLVARTVAQKLNEAMGVGVVVDNRGGAGGTIGSELLAKAPTDGYTIGLVSGSHTINPSLYRKLPYDTLKDFAPITLVVLSPAILVINPTVPARSLKEFIQLAKAKPGQLVYGSAGNGTPPHLAMELLKSMAGIDLVHVPYKGNAAVFNDLLGGQIAATIPSIPSALPLVRAGKLRGLAVTTRMRSAAAPDIPTMAEAGVPGYQATSWYGLVAPAGTPRYALDRLHKETAQALHSGDVKERFIAQGLDPVGNTPQEFAAMIAAELPQWAKVVKAAGAKID
jgi:tripartite-type tricarboxylate transporter receptor subunit TctC